MRTIGGLTSALDVPGDRGQRSRRYLLGFVIAQEASRSLRSAFVQLAWRFLLALCVHSAANKRLSHAWPACVFSGKSICSLPAQSPLCKGHQGERRFLWE